MQTRVLSVVVSVLTLAALLTIPVFAGSLLGTAAADDETGTAPFTVEILGCLDMDSTVPATVKVDVTHVPADWNVGYTLEVGVRFRNRSTARSYDYLIPRVTIAPGATETWLHSVPAAQLGPNGTYRNWDVRVGSWWTDASGDPVMFPRSGYSGQFVPFIREWNSYNFVPPCAIDTDSDGVLDDVDMCPATTLDDPPAKLKKNRFATNAAGLFVDVNGTESGFSVVDTFGCDEDQIIGIMELGKGHNKFGITRGVLRTFTSMY